MLKKIGIMLLVAGGCGALGLYLIGIAGGYFRYLSPTVAFLLYVVGMLLGLLMSIAGIIDMAKNGSSARSLALMCALIPAVNLVYGAVEARNYPRINDISTDLVFPPEITETESGKSPKFPMKFKKDIETRYTDISPLALKVSVDDVHMSAIKAIEGKSTWVVTSNQIGDRETIIEGTVTSEVFGFVDDFVIRLKEPRGGAGCVVDMRSRSRLGLSDFGKNAEHIREFMEDVQ